MWLQYETLTIERLQSLKPGTLRGLDKSLQGKDYLLDSFTAADVAVGSTLSWLKGTLGDKVGPKL